jgi:hypothetical protein
MIDLFGYALDVTFVWGRQFAFAGRELSVVVQPGGGRGPRQGLVSDRLHIIDAADLAAEVDLFRLRKEPRDGDDDQQYVDRISGPGA